MPVVGGWEVRVEVLPLKTQVGERRRGSGRLRKELFQGWKLPSGAEARTHVQRVSGTSKLVLFPFVALRAFSCSLARGVAGELCDLASGGGGNLLVLNLFMLLQP